MEILYDKKICNEKKSNNWKRMHGIPMKATEKTISGVHIFEGRLDPGYVSRRSRKKQKKSHFRSGYSEIAAICIGKLKLNRIYHRYGYMRKKYKRMSKPFNGAAYNKETEILLGEFTQHATI